MGEIYFLVRIHGIKIIEPLLDTIKIGLMALVIFRKIQSIAVILGFHLLQILLHNVIVYRVFISSLCHLNPWQTIIIIKRRVLILWPQAAKRTCLCFCKCRLIAAEIVSFQLSFKNG